MKSTIIQLTIIFLKDILSKLQGCQTAAVS